MKAEQIINEQQGKLATNKEPYETLNDSKAPQCENLWPRLRPFRSPTNVGATIRGQKEKPVKTCENLLKPIKSTENV